MDQKRIVNIALLVGMAVWLGLEHRARREQGREIAMLQQQLDQMAERVAENGGISNLVTQTRQLQMQSDDQVRRLVQLRDEVRVLRQQTNEIESLRGEIFQVRTAIGGVNAQNPAQTATSDRDPGSNSSRLQILEAYYWTQNQVIDVTQQLRKRILNDKLEVIAGNDLRGDPEYGQVKTLTLVYRYDGITATNEVREGGLVLIPPE